MVHVNTPSMNYLSLNVLAPADKAANNVKEVLHQHVQEEPHQHPSGRVV